MLIYPPDVVPETLFITVIMVFNCGVFGYSINECKIINIFSIIFLINVIFFKWET